MFCGKLSVLSVFFLCVSFSQIYFTKSNYIEPARVKRGIFGTVTSTVTEIIEKKFYISASCIYMDPKLTNYCRNVRFLFPQNHNFFYTGNEIAPTSTAELKPSTPETIVAAGRQAANQTKTVYIQGWGEYLGFYQPTVTVTHTKIQPTTVLDPWITITYAIKGCKPHNLPKDIDKCPEEDRLELAEIVPTSTVRARIEATQIPEIDNFAMPGVPIEGADVEMVEVPENNRATKSL